ncbi:MAG TPA: Ig-like domain-containing protein [Candidatus Polarisedimenticolia bacterium]|nr:Ig-like domain-containing protein [Candidatus Polarisedimenticolia bacterium]
MSSTKHKIRLAGGFAFLATLALTISCTGFFVNPTVSAITIDPPNPTVSQGLTTQLTAAGTDSNGNAITLTGGTSCSGTTVCWSSGTPTVATITTGGLLTGVSAGTTTITASSGTASATATATVTLGNVTSIVVGPVTSFNLPENSVATGNDCLTAKATAGGTTVDVTASVTWVPGDSTIITVQNGVTPMCVQSLANPGPTTVVAQYISGTNTVTSNTVTITVSP